jgi:hypothetical protein
VIAHANTRPSQTFVETRPLANTAELIASYRLRYEVYSDLGYLAHGNRSRLELDAYDRHAIPFGAFDGSGTLVGTLRLITDAVQAHYASAIGGLLGQLDDEALRAQASQARTQPLPTILSPHIAAQVERYNVGRFPVCELSRTIVHPTRRGVGVSRYLIELGLAHASRRGPVVLVGSCLPEHVPMYTKYGYTTIPGTTFDRYDSVGQIARALICRSDQLPHPTRGHVDELVRRLSDD